jgi:biotin synthase
MTSLPPAGFSALEGEIALEQRAGALRDEVFGRQVFVRGVIEASNFCRQNCNYCGMRRDNRDLKRFRLELSQLREVIREGLPEVITDLNLQTGEDTVGIREVILPLVEMLREETKLGISVCLGTLDTKLYDDLRRAGASYYIIKIETGNPEHYRAVQAPGTFEKRIEAIRYLASTGWSVSSGFIVGLPGQTKEHIEETLDLLGRLPLAGASVSPFISGEDGYVRALNAGANLATINLTPPVNRDDYLLYKRSRHIMHEKRVRAAIEAAGCTISTVSLAETMRRRREDAVPKS